MHGVSGFEGRAGTQEHLQQGAPSAGEREAERFVPAPDLEVHVRLRGDQRSNGSGAAVLNRAVEPSPTVRVLSADRGAGREQGFDALGVAIARGGQQGSVAVGEKAKARVGILRSEEFAEARQITSRCCEIERHQQVDPNDPKSAPQANTSPSQRSNNLVTRPEGGSSEGPPDSWPDSSGPCRASRVVKSGKLRPREACT